MSRQAASAKPANAAPAAPVRQPALSTIATSVATALAPEEERASAPPRPLPLSVAKGRPDDPPVDFSRVANRGPEILDADTERARITRLLLTELAPALGLDLSRLRITVDAAGAARIDARGASGLQEDTHLLLHPSRYRPDSSQGRYLLAHEAVHAAQRQLANAPVGDAREQIAAAEAEAGELGRDFAGGRALRRPRVALRRLEALADSGEAETQETAPVPALVDSVKLSRSREIALIKDALDGWWVSDGDVFTVMRVLDSLSFEVATAVVRALEPPERYWLVDNINPPHVYQHRRSVLVAYGALEAGKFDAIDLKVLRALPISGMSTQESEAAVRTVRSLSPGDIESLLASEKGDAIAKLIGAPALDPEKKEQLRLAEQNAAKDEAALATRREKILQLAEDSGVQAVVKAVRKQLSTPDDAHGEPRHPHPGDAIAVVELLGRHSADETRFLAIAELLEAEGLVDSLLELMPASKFFDKGHPEYTRTLIGLVQSRLAIKNEQMIEELLSYGFFDWAIRDYEARFAYELIRLMPMSSQYRFRQRDGGKWYLRLLDNLPDAGSRPGLEIRKAETREERDRMVAAGATRDPGAGEEDLYYNASAMYEKKIAENGVRDELNALIAGFEEADKGIFRDHEAIALYKKIVALGGASLEPGKEDAGDTIKREALVRELDRHGLIACLFDQLPDSFLFAEENRISTVKIMLSRDSIHVQQHARDLVSYGLGDWLVWDSEAYLAYQCIKALPAEEREAFVESHPDLWSRIQGEMSVSMRQKRDTNLYIGDKEGTDRAAVLAQLADAKVWTAENHTVLDSLLRMALAMTEHRFAFARSREFAAVNDKALADLVAKYRLWDPASGRDDYSPETLKGTRWHEEGIFASLKSLWGGLVTLWNMDVLFVDGKIGATVDLNNVQDYMGGDLMGARLADPAKSGSRQEPVSKDANKLTLLLDPAWLEADGVGKSAEVILPQLLIESTNVQTANTTIQTGEVDLRNLHIRAAYDAQNAGQPAQAHVTLDSLIANDLLIARSGAMYTITRLVVETLRLAAGTIDSTTGAPPAMRKGRYIPFPLLALAMLPWLAQIAVTQLIAMPIRRLGKLPDQGLEPESRFQPDMLARTKSIDVSFSKLSAEGFSTSGGQHVAYAAIEDFTLRVGLNKATRLRAELASIDDRLKALDDSAGNDDARTRLQTRRATLLAEQKKVEAQEQRYLAIQQQIHAGGLDGVRQRELQQELDDLDFEDTGAVFLDVGRVEASGISGTVTARDKIELKNIHGEGGSSALLGMVSGPTATPAELARRAKGERAPPSFSKEREGAFSLELGDISTGHLEVGGGVRGVKQIEKELADIGDIGERPELAPLVESLHILHGKAKRYEAMVAYGVSALDPKQLDEFRELRRVLTADAAVIVESIKLTRAQLDVDLASGRADFSAKELRVGGLKLPQNGIEVEEIVAKGLSAGGMPKNGLLDWKKWRETLADADAKIDSLEITKARSKYHGLLFEKATLTGAYAGMKERGNLIEAGFAQLNVQGLGLVPRLGLMNQRLAGLREKLRVAAETDKPAIQDEVDKLATHLAEMQALADRRQLAYLRLAQAKTPDEISKAKEDMVEVDGTIALGLAQYGAAEFDVDKFGVKVTGAGDVLSDALAGGIDPMSVMSRGGVNIVGTGPDKRLFERIALKQAQGAVEGPGKSLTGDVADFEIGETRLDLSARKKGDSLFVDFPTFDVDSLSVNQLLVTSSPTEGPGWQVWSYGASGIDRFSISGNLRLDSRVKDSQDLSDYRLAHVHIDSFKIGSIHGNGLGLSLPEKKLEVEIVSGAINDITGTNVDVTFPADPKAETIMTGNVGIKSIDKLVLGKAVWDTWAVNHGRIDAKDIGISTVKDGGIEIGVGDLDLTDFALRGPDGWVRLNLKDLGTKATWKDGELDIDDLHFGSLAVSGVHWKVGETGFVESNKLTTITGLKLKGKIKTEQTAAKGKDGKETGEKQRKLSGIHIETLDIDKIESERLVYQDEDSRIELGEADPATQKKMLGFKPLFLQNLKVWGLDWKPGGMTAGKFEIGSYEANAHYKDLKSSLVAGLALRGTGMSGEVVGPGAYTLDVGKVKETGGELHSDAFDTEFGTGAIVGKFAMGPDYVEAQGVEIDRTQLSSIRYRDLPRTLELDTVNIGKIKLGKVRQNYSVSTTAKTKGEKTPTTLEVRDLELFDVLALNFKYHGEAEAKVMKEGIEQTEKTTQDIRGNSATISHLQVSAFDRNAIDNTSSITAKIDTATGAATGTQPFGVKGLVANLASTIGSETSRKELTTDIEGGPITANGMKFKTVVLGEVGTGADVKDVTRTEIDGEFELTRLGFINPDLTITDSKGRTRVHSADGTSGSIEISGIKPRFMPNGTVSLPISSVIAKGLEIKIGDNKTVQLPLLKITGIAAGLRGMGTEEGLDMLATEIKSIYVEGLEIEIVKPGKAELTDEEFEAATRKFEAEREAAKKNPPARLIVEPLSDLIGNINGEYSQDYWEDPDIHAKIEGGELNFADVTNYGTWLKTEDVTRNGVTAPEDKLVLGGAEIDLVEFKRKMPGFHGGSWESGSNGRINFREMVEGLANEPGKAPSRTSTATPKLRNLIDFSGELALGEGRIGMDKGADGSLGADDDWIDLERNESDQNVFTLKADSIGDELGLNMTQFHAGAAEFDAGETNKKKKRRGKIDDITLNELDIKIRGLADLTLRITIKVQNGTITDVQIGDVTLTDPAKLGTLVAPELKDVDPKGRPKAPPAGGTP